MWSKCRTPGNQRTPPDIAEGTGCTLVGVNAEGAVSTLYRGGQVYDGDRWAGDALLVVGETIAWVGSAGESGAPDLDAVDEVAELDGALVLPAFVDAHVHATATGLTLIGLDLSECCSPAELLDALHRYAGTLPADAVVLGHGWDDSRWAGQRPPSIAEVTAAAGGRMSYLSRVDAHSALVTASLLEALDRDGAGRLAGYDGGGLLSLDAHQVARRTAYGSITPAQREQAQRATLRRAAEVGIAAIHECAGPSISSEDDLIALLRLAESVPGPKVFGLWGELLAAEKAVELGAVGAAGDLSVDGALGSRTAHVSEPYVGVHADWCGHAYLGLDEVTAHVVDCARVGLPAGFHAIGDAAVETVIGGFERAAATLAPARIKAGRHRVEHAEMLTGDQIERLARLRITVSAQPAFDAAWGGDDGMYVDRLGSARAAGMNPFRNLAAAGVPLAFGSDAPVTPLDPWGGVRAAARHHRSEHRLSVSDAFAAHTIGGWRALPANSSVPTNSVRTSSSHFSAGPADSGLVGRLRPGAPAHFAVWVIPDTDGDPDLATLASIVDGTVPRCVRTVVDGRTGWVDGG